MTQSQIAPTDLLRERIRDDIDDSIVVTDASEIPLYSSDVYAEGTPPALVIKPAEVQQVPSIVKIATSMGFAITQRGGGMSYTGGYLPTQANTVMLDLSALNRIISINEDDLVITVEAGVTWQQIWEALRPGPASAFLRHVFGKPSDRRGWTVERGIIYGTRAMVAPPTCGRHGGH